MEATGYSPLEIQLPTHWNLIDLSHDCLTAWVIAQQYSSAMPIHSGK
jgi:hypothetical protein